MAFFVKAPTWSIKRIAAMKLGSLDICESRLLVVLVRLSQTFGIDVI